MSIRLYKHITSPLVFLTAIIVSSAAQADCKVDVDALHKTFKSYREQINTATKLEELTHFFSSNFNQYFIKKLRSADNEDANRRYLTQYWDNLNTAKDIVIVFDYSAHCTNSSANLVLVSILSSETVTKDHDVELWTVTINYINENNNWKIDSFEYEKVDAKQEYLATDIKDNFVKIH